MTDASRGIVWVAFGYGFLGMALHSARTAAQCAPSLGRALITNLPLESAKDFDHSLFDYINVVDGADYEAFRWKLSVEQYVPWEHALFLDADIEVRRDPSPVFNVLENYPFAICPRGNPCNKTGDLWGESLANCGLREFNSGVFAFDNHDPRVKDFFSRLRTNHSQRNERIDQPSFMVTIYQDPSFPIAPLSLEWNATNRWEEARAFVRKYPEKIGFYHYRDPHRFFDIEAAMAETLRAVDLSFSYDAERHTTAFNEFRREFFQLCRGKLRLAWDRLTARP